MGCASGKKTHSECRPLPCTSVCSALHVPATQTEAVGEAVAPVSLLLMAGEEARPKAAKPVLLPKKPLAGNKDELLTLSKFPVLGKHLNCTVPTSPSTLELSLPSVRNITGSKVAFNKIKFQVANTTSAAETGLGPVPKPPSSLSLLQPQASLLADSSSPVVRSKALEGTAGSTLVPDFL